MTEREKMTISKTDLYKLRDISLEISKLWQNKEALIMSLYGTGIDYSKDRVQTSPVNMMEEAFSSVSEIDQRLDKLLKSRKVYVEKIYKMNNDEAVNLLIDIYRNCKSHKQMAHDMKVARSTVYEKQNRALVEYYNTNYGGNTCNRTLNVVK